MDRPLLTEPEHPGWAAGDAASVQKLPRRHASASEVDLYCADLDELYSTINPTDLVSADEIAQAGLFPTALLRGRFLRARALLRQVLARYVDGSGSALQFDRSCTACGAQHGKPRLEAGARGDSGLQFSVSRSGPLCLIAVSAGEVGVDVEVFRDLDCEAIADKEFGESEAGYIRSLPPASRVEAFLAMWVRKEALAKAVGTGLTHETLRAGALGQPARVRLAEHGDWTVVDVKLGRSSRAAIAARPQVQTIRVVTTAAKWSPVVRSGYSGVT